MSKQKLTPGLLDIKGLAKQLNIPVSGIRKLVSKRKIPLIKLSPRTFRFSLAAVERALEKLTVETV